MRPMITTLREEPKPNGHCASVAPLGDGVILAFYGGPECHDRQHVILQYWEHTTFITERHLYPKTGNCVVWPTDPNRAGLIHSYFNDTDGIHYPTKAVHRWMYCSNWQSTIQLENNKLIITNTKQLNTQPSIGFLTRINPIKINDTWLLPMYREKRCYGQIMNSVDGYNWHTAGSIGLDTQNGMLTAGYLIQPTLWYDGTILRSLSRSTNMQTKFAWYSESNNLGYSWTDPSPTFITNYNNSLVVIDDGTDTPWIIWNRGMHRNCLAIGKYNHATKAAIPYAKLNNGGYASYPNYCYDSNDNLHIVHTDNGSIARHILRPEALHTLEEIGPNERGTLVTINKLLS